MNVFGVDIFFVISGFILSTVVLRSPHHAGPGAAWHFLKRRLIRIFPIYWIIAIPVGLRVFHASHHLGIEYLPGLFLLPSFSYPAWAMIEPAAWTLIFEMLFYYTLTLVQLLTVRRAVLCAIVVLSSFVALGTVVSIRRPYWIVICNPILLEFIFGACVALIFQKFGRQRSLGISLVAIGVVGSVLLEIFYSGAANGLQMVLTNQHVFARVFTWGLMALALVMGVIFWSPTPTGWLGKTAVILGNASYSVYLVSILVHEAAARSFLAVVRNYLPLSNGLQLVGMVLTTAEVMFAGWLCYQLVEWPLLRKLQARLL